MMTLKVLLGPNRNKTTISLCDYSTERTDQILYFFIIIKGCFSYINNRGVFKLVYCAASFVRDMQLVK